MIVIGSYFTNCFNNLNYLAICSFHSFSSKFSVNNFHVINERNEWTLDNNGHYWIMDFWLFYLDTLHLVKKGNLKLWKSILKVVDSLHWLKNNKLLHRLQFETWRFPHINLVILSVILVKPDLVNPFMKLLVLFTFVQVNPLVIVMFVQINPLVVVLSVQLMQLV